MSSRPPEPGLLRLAVELLMLPVQTLLHGMERMLETLRDMQRITDRGADSWLGSRALPPAAGGTGAAWPPAVTRDPVPGGPVPRDPVPLDPGHPTFREPRTAGGARDGTGGPTSKKERRMYQDHDLSGDMVKVVQYCIVSVVTGIDDNARVVVPPQVVAFGDDMTPEDFTAWMIADNCESIDDYKRKIDHKYLGPGPRPWDRKFLRVAFSVMSRFAPADIDWTELQALSVAKIAAHFPAPEPKGGSKLTKGGS